MDQETRHRGGIHEGRTRMTNSASLLWFSLLVLLASCEAGEITTVRDVATYEFGTIDYRDPRAVVATIDDEPIYLSDVVSNAFWVDSPLTAETFDDLLDQLIVARIALRSASPVSDARIDSRFEAIFTNTSRAELETEIEAQGITIEQLRERIREDLALEDLASADVRVPTDHRIAEYYAENIAAFYIPERIIFRHFYLSPENRTSDEIIELIEGYLASEDVCAYIEAHSDMIDGPCGLLILNRGDLIPELEYGIYGTPINETRVIESPLGVHVVTVQDVLASEIVPLSEARDSIVEFLTREERSSQLQQRLSKDIRAASITIIVSR